MTLLVPGLVMMGSGDILNPGCLGWTTSGSTFGCLNPGKLEKNRGGHEPAKRAKKVNRLSGLDSDFKEALGLKRTSQMTWAQSPERFEPKTSSVALLEPEL